jgi:rod shape-determining protein MreC
MYFLSRWWRRSWVALGLALLGLGAAWSIRQTEGTIILELYRLVMLPTQADGQKQEQLLQAETWSLQQQVAELEAQNQALRTLLAQPKLQQEEAIATPLIGRSADDWWQQVILGKGQAAGIKVGSTVLAPGGLVGRVTKVTPHTSRVLLVSDPSSRIGVTVTRSRHMGILHGQANNYAVIDFFEKDPDVRIGDTIVTSSLSRLFPSGVPIGRVKSLNLEKAYNPQAVVEFTVPIGNLEWVSVQLNDQTAKPLVSPGS